MAFFRITGCDENVLEMKIFSTLEGRNPSNWKQWADLIDRIVLRERDLQRIAVLKHLCQEQEKTIEGQRRHIEAMYNTLSWRITKPIRLVKQLLTNGFT